MDFSLIPIVFGVGIDTKTDGKQISGKLLQLQNGVFETGMEIRKRYGFTGLTQNNTSPNNLANNVIPNSVVSGNFIAPLNDEIVLGDGYCLFSYSPSENKWIYKGTAPTTELTVSSVVRNTYSQTCPDSAWSLTAGLFAWEDSSTGGILVSVVDKATGQTTVYNSAVSTTGQGPRVVYLASVDLLVCVYYDTSSGTLKQITWDGTTLTAPATFNTDIASTTVAGTHQYNYDLEVHTVSGTEYIYLAYNAKAAAGPAVTRYSNLLVQGTVKYLAGAENAGEAITLFFDDSDNVWVPYVRADGLIRYAIANAALTVTVLAATTVDNASPNTITHITGVYNPDTSAGIILYDFAAAIIKSKGVSVTGTVINAVQSPIAGCGLASRAFIIRYGTHYIPMVTAVYSSQLQPTYFTFGLYNQTTINNFQSTPVVAKIQPGAAGTIITHLDGYACTVLPGVNNTSDGNYQFAIGQKDNLFTSVTNTGTVATYSSTGVANAHLDFTLKNPQNVNMASELQFGGGLLSLYDGANSTEHGFHLFPEGNLFAPAGGGGSLGAGQYGYQITYEWTDNLGQFHVSAPSPVASVTSAGVNSRVVITLINLRITTKSNVYIGIYRTAANGTTYFKVATIANNFGSSNTTYTDTASDASIAASQQLYTTGGEVDNIAAPATIMMTAFLNRVVLIPSENPYTWWFSKEVIPGSPVQFSDQFVENVESNEGPLTGLMQLDANLILFKENSLYYVSGQGPAPSGAFNDFSNPLKIPSDTGCNNFKSIVSMPMGLMFQSPKGIYLLDRSLKAEYIGAPVAAFNNQTVVSAIHMPGTTQIRFILDSGTALLYDYFYQQWGTFTNYNSVSSTYVNQQFYRLQSAGLVLEENTGFSDNGTPIVLYMQLAPASEAGLQGYERIRKLLILGQWFSSHNLTLTMSYNFTGTVTQTVPIPVPTDPAPYQFRVFLNQQKMQTLILTIQDDGGTGTGTQSMSLSGFLLEAAPKKGFFKMPSAKSYG